MFSRPEPGTRASIQPIGNPVPVPESAISTFQTLLNNNANAREQFKDNVANASKQFQANKMRQAYSSFLSGLG
jgi:hypothetical protein|tara:strand:+ start:397 stop:615 length:219 start_codon:yes stop_codon:yes gene_type:complete